MVQCCNTCITLFFCFYFLLDGFGNKTRIDYGTGMHNTSECDCDTLLDPVRLSYEYGGTEN